ncbi:putative LPS assembly protein LptD [Sungkyunkwania multivorans]|uniref:LPS assembly protein LptD n=1 Tax=Sungkyunkwania multivorans TaxID=1173618 RepID=A0ABW3CX89_9FLAO
MSLQKLGHTFTKIGYTPLQTTSRHILLSISFALFFAHGFSQEGQEKSFENKDKPKDSLNLSINEILPEIRTAEIDTTEVDSITQDSVTKKPLLEGKVHKEAKEYMRVSRKEGKLYLYDEAVVEYLQTKVEAGSIVLNYETNEVFAKGIRDSLGNYVQPPIFTQGGDVVEPDSILFNYDSKRALIWNSRTEQNDFKVFGDITKRENDSVVYIQNARFTTSKNLEDPDYYIRARRIKLVPKKKIVAGFSNMYIADVPTPIGLPFAYFPLQDEATAGFIFPTLGENNERGYFFQNGGYYFPISDYIDLAVLGDYYTNGSYGFRLESTYAWRYHYRGNFSYRFENLIRGERGFPNFSKSRIYNIVWTHSQDSKANPNSRFSASVRLGSSQFFRQSVNQLSTPNFLNNSLNSSISYSKTFSGYPSVNLSLTATHSQNTNTEIINMTLPTLQASVERIFPFAKRDSPKKGIIENINFQYNVRGENRIQTTDSLFLKSEMFEDARVGMQHSIPVSTNFKVAKHFSVSMGGTYTENWTLNTIRRNDFDPTLGASTIDTLNNFDAFRQYNFSASIGTTIYGTFDREKDGQDRKIKAIRHVMRPTVSYNINPAFDQYYDTYIIDADGNTAEFTRFEQSLFGTPSRTFSSSIGMALSNNFEAKVRDKDSTATEPKKIVLLNNLNFSTAYNIAADSLAWSPVRMNGNTAIFNSKMNINFGATFDPYALDNNNRRINTFNIDNGGSLFRLTSANVNVNYSFSSKSFESKKTDDDNLDNARNGGRSDDLFGEAQDFTDNRFFAKDDENEEEERPSLYKATIPWDLRLAYTITYSNAQRQNDISNNSLMFSGNVKLGTKWKVGASSGYDFKNKGFTFTQFRFERDLDSFRMNFNWVPFSARSSWYFFIGIKSNILRDLKYDKRREPDRRL